MKKKRMAYTILLCVWIGFNYIGIFGDAFERMAEYLAFDRDPPQFISTFQLWFFNILSLIFDSVFIAVATGIFAYHFRELKTWHYIVLALFVRYLGIVIILSWAIWHVPSLLSLEALRETGSILEHAIMGLMRLALSVAAAYVGMSYGLDANYLDEKDEGLGYIAGVSKKLWALLMLVFNPVVLFVTELSIVILHGFARDVASKQYWSDTWGNLFWGDVESSGGIVSLIFKLFSVAFVWMITIATFYYGIETIGRKESNYRLIKIFAIFVVLPMAILFIPIIRNRTWFF